VTAIVSLVTPGSMFFYGYPLKYLLLLLYSSCELGIISNRLSTYVSSLLRPRAQCFQWARFQPSPSREPRCGRCHPTTPHCQFTPMAGNDKIVALEVIFPIAGEASPRPCVTSGVPCLHRPLDPLHTVLDNKRWKFHTSMSASTVLRCWRGACGNRWR
jgi:hypothetical protein